MYGGKRPDSTQKFSCRHDAQAVRESVSFHRDEMKSTAWRIGVYVCASIGLSGPKGAYIPTRTVETYAPPTRRRGACTITHRVRFFFQPDMRNLI
jgi:hypothetical protein